jgi:hypothetical protein
MFGASATVRDVLFGQIQAHGYNVFFDKRVPMEGKQSGARKFWKHYKGFGKTGNGTVLKYDMDSDGNTNGDVADDEKYFHIYAMDIFQYGINGLDERIPGSASVGKKRGSDQATSGVPAKRTKSDSSYDHVMDGVDDLSLGGKGKVTESAVGGVVRIKSDMKLYWYEPK